MKRKYFDINRGHYVLLEETSTDVSQSTNPDEQNQNNQNNQQQKPDNKSVETNKEIQDINTQLNDLNTKYNNSKNSENQSYNTDKSNQEKLLNAAMKSVEDATGQYDAVQTNPEVLAIKKKLVDIELKHVQNMCSIELDHANKVADIEKKRIDVLTKIANESWKRQLPEKYKVLNESNVQNAKIYLDILIGDDMLITGMPDFKNVFKDSDMVYGKDKKGYFAICIDKEDFEKLYKVLYAVGYGRDDIFSTVMSQVLDRSEMIAINN